MLGTTLLKKSSLSIPNVEDILFGGGEIKLKKAHFLIYFSLTRTLCHRNKILTSRNEYST